MSVAPSTVAPVSPWAVHMAVIRQVRPETPAVRTYELELAEDSVRDAYAFAPGQFNMLYVPGVGEAAISISSDADKPPVLSHTVRTVGNVTEALARHQAGDQIGIRGPFGSAWPVQSCRGGDVVVAAGGIGLAPLRPVIHHILNHRQHYGQVWLLYGARKPADLLYDSEYETWRRAGIDVEITVDLAEPGWQGRIGVVPSLFQGLKISPERTSLLTCGPEIMMRYVVFEGLGRGISPERIYLSMERNMNCAIGFCGHCQLGPAFICKDGPVFSYPKMEPYLHLEDL